MHPRPVYAARTAEFLARTRKSRPNPPENDSIPLKPPEVANDDARAAFMKGMSRDLDSPEIEPDHAGPKL